MLREQRRGNLLLERLSQRNTVVFWKKFSLVGSNFPFLIFVSLPFSTGISQASFSGLLKIIDVLKPKMTFCFPRKCLVPPCCKFSPEYKTH